MYAHYVLMSESSAKLVVMWWHGGVGSAVEIQVHCMGDQNGGWNIVKLLIVERAGQLGSGSSQVHMCQKMRECAVREKAEEQAGKTEWISQVNERSDISGTKRLI